MAYDSSGWLEMFLDYSRWIVKAPDWSFSAHGSTRWYVIAVDSQ